MESQYVETTAFSYFYKKVLVFGRGLDAALLRRQDAGVLLYGLFTLGGDSVFQRFAGQIDDIVYPQFVHDMCPVVLDGASGAF